MPASNLATIDISAPSMKRLMATSGKAPPIGASPGELRLWLKQNGLLDEAMKRCTSQPSAHLAFSSELNNHL